MKSFADLLFYIMEKLLWPPPPSKETFNDFQFAFTKSKANKRAKHSINEELY